MARGKVGVVGLGIMGSAYAANLRRAGVQVVGVDPAPAGRVALEALGGQAHDALGPWVAEGDLVIVSVASPKVLAAVATALGGLLSKGQVALETGTFALADKFAAKAAVEVAGAILLDCPVSGTGAQAAKADLVIMASGDPAAIVHAKPYLSHISHTVIEAGAFGYGSRMKYVANHAVALHNAAAAETLHYATSLGLDAGTVYKMLSGGAGQSRMSDLRMPLMIAKSYEPPTASMAMFQKDLSIIGDNIASQAIETPIFEAVCKLYDAAFESLPMSYDTAGVYEVYTAAK
jgi:L-threonate 2-dehydrogenase